MFAALSVVMKTVNLHDIRRQNAHRAGRRGTRRANPKPHRPKRVTKPTMPGPGSGTGSEMTCPVRDGKRKGGIAKLAVSPKTSFGLTPSDRRPRLFSKSQVKVPLIVLLGPPVVQEYERMSLICPDRGFSSR